MLCKSTNLCPLQRVSMNQYLYQALKFFALLIFSVELLAPVFCTDSTLAHKSQGEYQLVNATAPANQLFCLFAEELDSNEANGESHKEFDLLFNFDFLSTFYLPAKSKTSSLVSVQHTSQRFSVQPRLFLLHRLLLI